MISSGIARKKLFFDIIKEFLRQWHTDEDNQYSSQHTRETKSLEDIHTHQKENNEYKKCRRITIEDSTITPLISETYCC